MAQISRHAQHRARFRCSRVSTASLVFKGEAQTASSYPETTTTSRTIAGMDQGSAASTSSEQIQPDLIHALRIPYEGIVAAAACPPNVPLAVSIWGNDLTMQASANPLIARATRRVLARTDLLYADCQRDLDLARKWGLRPIALRSLLPGGGGIDFRSSPVRPALGTGHLPTRSNHRIVINARGLREYVRNDTLLGRSPYWHQISIHNTNSIRRRIAR